MIIKPEKVQFYKTYLSEFVDVASGSFGLSPTKNIEQIDDEELKVSEKKSKKKGE